MRTFLILATLAVTLAPDLALAMRSCSHARQQGWQPCPQGQAWDFDLKACTAVSG